VLATASQHIHNSSDSLEMKIILFVTKKEQYMW